MESVASKFAPSQVGYVVCHCTLLDQLLIKLTTMSELKKDLGIPSLQNFKAKMSNKVEEQRKRVSSRCVL